MEQSLAITLMNLRNIRARLGSSLVVAVGIAGVVAVLIGILAMAAGFGSALTSSAAPDRGIILGHGSQNEMNSWLTQEEVNVISDFEGFDIVSKEVFVVVTLTDRDTGDDAYVVGRGVSGEAFALRPELRIVRGRMFERGRAELIVGTRAAQQYEGLDIGQQIELRNSLWTVTGHFDTGGTAMDSEVWVDLDLAQSLFRRDLIGTVRVKLSDPAVAPAVQPAFDRDPRVNVTFLTEETFYAAQSEARVRLIQTFAYFIGGIMALGAVLAALNAMYVAVGSRTVEIATLRALGFGTGAVVMSVVAEALLLSLLGGAVGATLAYAAIDGYSATTLNGASNSQVAFELSVTPGLIALGLFWALVLGLIGGLLPALRAARLPLTEAMRGA